MWGKGRTGTNTLAVVVVSSTTTCHILYLAQHGLCTRPFPHITYVHKTHVYIWIRIHSHVFPLFRLGSESVVSTIVKTVREYDEDFKLLKKEYVKVCLLSSPSASC